MASKPTHDDTSRPSSSWLTSDATDYEEISKSLLEILRILLKNKKDGKLNPSLSKLAYWVNATNGYINMFWFQDENGTPATGDDSDDGNLQLKELWEVSLDHVDGASHFDFVCRMAIEHADTLYYYAFEDEIQKWHTTPDQGRTNQYDEESGLWYCPGVKFFYLFEGDSVPREIVT